MTDLEEIIEELNPVQKQVARLTKELCNLLDATRPLSKPLRIDMLERATISLKEYTRKTKAVNEMNPYDKRRLTMKLLKRQRKTVRV